MIEVIKDKIQELLGTEYDVYLNNTVDVLQKDKQYKNLCVLIAQSGDIEPLKGISGLNANCSLVMSYQASMSGYEAEEDKIQWATTLAEEALQTLAAQSNGYIQTDDATWNYIFNFSVPKPMNATTLNGEIWYNVVLPINIIITTDLMFGNSGTIKIGNPYYVLYKNLPMEEATTWGTLKITFSAGGIPIDSSSKAQTMRFVITGSINGVVQDAYPYSLAVTTPNPDSSWSEAADDYYINYMSDGTTAAFTFLLHNPPEGYTAVATVETNYSGVDFIDYDFSMIDPIDGITKWDYIFTNNLEYVAKVDQSADNRAKAVQVFSNLQMPIELFLMATSQHYNLLTQFRNNPTTRLYAEFTLPIATDTDGTALTFRDVFVILPKDIHISGSLGQFIALDITLSEALNE